MDVMNLGSWSLLVCAWCAVGVPLLPRLFHVRV